MARRAYLAHGLNGVFLLVFGFFAFSFLLVGVLIIIAAERAAEVQQTSELGLYIGGAVFAVVGLLMVRSTLRNLGAVALIDAHDDGSWTLRTRFGRVVAEVPPDLDRRLELEGSELWLAASAVPRRQAVVEGRLHLHDDRILRLAVSGPYTYDEALTALGYQVAAPRPGERIVV